MHYYLSIQSVVRVTYHHCQCVKITKKSKPVVTVFKQRPALLVLRSGAAGGPDEAFTGAKPSAGAEDQTLEQRLRRGTR